MAVSSRVNGSEIHLGLTSKRARHPFWTSLVVLVVEWKVGCLQEGWGLPDEVGACRPPSQSSWSSPPYPSPWPKEGDRPVPQPEHARSRKSHVHRGARRKARKETRGVRVVMARVHTCPSPTWAVEHPTTLPFKLASHFTGFGREGDGETPPLAAGSQLLQAPRIHLLGTAPRATG